MKKIDWLIILSIIIISIIVLKDLFKPGMYTSHDGIHQIVRFFYFDQALHDGQIPPRWAQGLMNGFGYPLFIFSYHLPWFIAEFIHLLGSSIIDSVKMTFLVGFALSGITMYFMQRDLFGRLAAITGTGLFLFAPYRFSNIFVRAAIGDATVFIFAPLVFWALWKLKNGWNWKWMSLGSIGIAGLILSHAMVATLFMAIFTIYVISSLSWVKNKFNYLKNCFITFILGLGISAYYFIPSVFERGNTQFQNLMSQIFTGVYFPSFSDLLYSKWGYGVFHAKEGAMSVQLGIVQWAVVILTILVILRKMLNKKLAKNQKEIVNLGKILILTFCISIIMMLSVTLPIWKAFSQMVFIDFPWRMLSVSTFLVSICAGLLISTAKKFKTVLAVILIFSAIYFNRNHLRINETLPWDLSFILKLEKTTNSYDEYTPKWVRPDLVKENAPKVELSDLRSNLNISRNTSNKLELEVNSPAEGNLFINTIYYPGWEAIVNGVNTEINYDNGLIKLPLMEGNSIVKLRFKETTLRLFSDILSIISILIITTGLIRFKMQAKRK